VPLRSPIRSATIRWFVSLQLFGEGGFAKIVEAVAAEERAMGIYELDLFIPKIEAD